MSETATGVSIRYQLSSRMVSRLAYTDKALVCRDCKQNFTFTSSEQEAFAGRGLMNAPSRCADCRATRKASQGESAGRFPNSRSESSSGGSYAGGGDYDRPRREMHPAVCAECGKATQVPFLPHGDKPVYCSDCFETKRPPRAASSGRAW